MRPEGVGGYIVFFLLLLELGYPFALAKTIKKEHGKEGTKKGIYIRGKLTTSKSSNPNMVHITTTTTKVLP